MRKNSPQAGADYLVEMFQNLIKQNNSFEEGLIYEVKVHQLSTMISEIQFQTPLPEGLAASDCAICELFDMTCALKVYMHYEKDHPGCLALSYVPDKEFWISEIVKKIAKMLQTNTKKNFDVPTNLAATCSKHGLHDEANTILRACIMAMDRQQPNTLAAKQVALDLADNLIYSGNYDEAKILLQYVLQGRFHDLEVLEVSALSGMILVQDMTNDETKLLSKPLNIGSILKSAAEMLEKLRRLQSTFVVNGDLPAGMEYMDQELAGADLDNA
ncbi:MAG: hypothetical protein Q9164_006734 [Protoblastenia rupestris]